MIQPAITICLAPEAREGPFVFHGGLRESCAKAVVFGFAAVEIFPSASRDFNEGQLRQILQEHGLKLAAMGTGAGWLAQRLSLTSPNASVRLRALEFISGIISLAASFGAPAIIGSMQGRMEDGISREQALDWLGDALRELGSLARASGVPLLFEPLNRYETNLFNRIGQTVCFLETLRTANVKVLCDLFHMNIEERSIAEAIHEGGDRVGHIHFGDSNRQAAGLGHMDFKTVVGALRNIHYKGYASAEVFPLPTPDVAAQQTIAAFRSFFV